MKVKHYEVALALFVTTLLISNIVSIKLVHIGPLVFDAGTILFPLAYILGDVITEVYGFKKMRRTLLIGVSMLIMTMLTFSVVQILPASSDWGGQAAYESTLGVVWRIALASIVAITVGELLNAYVLAKMKIKTKGKQLWGRLIGSSAAGNIADTTVFSVIAFAGTIDFATLLNIIVTVFLLKMAIEIVVSPLTIRAIAWLKKSDKEDSFETPKLV